MVADANADTNGPANWGDKDGPGYLAGATLVGGAVGASIGAVVDASTKHQELLYKARKQKRRG